MSLRACSFTWRGAVAPCRCAVTRSSGSELVAPSRSAAMTSSQSALSMPSTSEASVRVFAFLRKVFPRRSFSSFARSRSRERTKILSRSPLGLRCRMRSRTRSILTFVSREIESSTRYRVADSGSTRGLTSSDDDDDDVNGASEHGARGVPNASRPSRDRERRLRCEWLDARVHVGLREARGDHRGDLLRGLADRFAKEHLVIVFGDVLVPLDLQIDVTAARHDRRRGGNIRSNLPSPLLADVNALRPRPPHSRELAGVYLPAHLLMYYFPPGQMPAQALCVLSDGACIRFWVLQLNPRQRRVRGLSRSQCCVC